jgi:hypothetical protein
VAPAAAGGAPAASHAVIPKCAPRAHPTIQKRTAAARRGAVNAPRTPRPHAHCAAARCAKAAIRGQPAAGRAAIWAREHRLLAPPKFSATWRNAASRPPTQHDTQTDACGRQQMGCSTPGGAAQPARKLARKAAQVHLPQVCFPSTEAESPLPATDSSTRTREPLSPWSSTESATGAWQCAARPKGGCRTSCRQHLPRHRPRRRQAAGPRPHQDVVVAVHHVLVAHAAATAQGKPRERAAVQVCVRSAQRRRKAFAMRARHQGSIPASVSSSRAARCNEHATIGVRCQRRTAQSSTS